MRRVASPIGSPEHRVKGPVSDKYIRSWLVEIAVNAVLDELPESLCSLSHVIRLSAVSKNCMSLAVREGSLAMSLTSCSAL